LGDLFESGGMLLELGAPASNVDVDQEVLREAWDFSSGREDCVDKLG
jgi:hypothetical protein